MYSQLLPEFVNCTSTVLRIQQMPIIQPDLQTIRDCIQEYEVNFCSGACGHNVVRHHDYVILSENFGLGTQSSIQLMAAGTIVLFYFRTSFGISLFGLSKTFPEICPLLLDIKKSASSVLCVCTRMCVCVRVCAPACGYLDGLLVF